MRDQLRHQREALRLHQVNERVQQQQFVVSRQEQAQALTGNVAAQVDALRAILRSAGHSTRETVFASLAIKEPPPIITVPEALAQPLPQPSSDVYVRLVRPPAWWEKMFAYRARYDREMARAQERFRADYARWQNNENARVAQVAELERQHKIAFAAFQGSVANRI